ncbi:MAG: Uma2 family endonuclease [Bryobacteraceae bacterium]
MATATEAPPITVEQYEAFEGFPGLRDQLIYGQIVMSPQPKPLHQQIVKNVLALLTKALEGRPYTAQTNTNVRFPDAHSMPAPDVLVVTKQQWQQACHTDQFLSVPPILVVEVVSPANRKVKRKVELYRDQGVLEVWVICPMKHTVRVHRGSPGVRTEMSLDRQGILTLPEPLEGSVAVASFFSIEEP